MGYKYKPNKSVAKRFRVSKTGKVKRHHSYTSHLMSSRPANKRRKLRRSAVLFEGHARNMRQMMGVSGIRPNEIAHHRKLDRAAQVEANAPEAIATPHEPTDSADQPSATPTY